MFLKKNISLCGVFTKTICQNIFRNLQGGGRWCRVATSQGDPTKEFQPKNINQRISIKEYQPKITHQRIPIPKNINQRRQWEEGASGKELGRPNQRISITDTGLQANTDQVEQADISAYWKIEGFLYWQKLQQKMSVKGVSQSCRCITGVWQKKLSASDWEKQGAVRACVIVVVIVGANGEKTNIRTS